MTVLMRTSKRGRPVGGRVPRVGAAVVAVLLVVSGCTSKDDGGDNADQGAAATLDDELNKATGTPVKVGLLNLEGSSVISLDGVGDGAVAAAEYANDYLGGLGGHPIEIVRCEDHADGASAQQCANKFVDEQVSAVVVGIVSTPDQFVPTIAAAHIPYFGSNLAFSIEASTPGLYFLSPQFYGITPAWALTAKNEEHESFGLMLTNNPQLVATLVGEGSFGQRMFDLAGVSQDVVTFNQDVADLSPQARAILDKDPDIIGINANAPLCQAALTALGTLGYEGDILLDSGCAVESVLDVAPAGTKIFSYGDTVSDDEETQLYRGIMNEYAPDVDLADPLNGRGYMSMLGLVRAANAGGLTGDISTESIRAAVESAEDVPLPLGRGETFSCGESALNLPEIKSTVCNSRVFMTEVTSDHEIDPNFTVVDPNELLGP